MTREYTTPCSCGILVVRVVLLKTPCMSFFEMQNCIRDDYAPYTSCFYYPEAGVFCKDVTDAHKICSAKILETHAEHEPWFGTFDPLQFDVFPSRIILVTWDGMGPELSQHPHFLSWDFVTSTRSPEAIPEA